MVSVGVCCRTILYHRHLHQRRRSSETDEQDVRTSVTQKMTTYLRHVRTSLVLACTISRLALSRFEKWRSRSPTFQRTVTLCHSQPVYQPMHSPSVRLSVTRRYSVETVVHTLKHFISSSNHNILVLHTKWYSNISTGTPLNGDVECKGGGWKTATFDQYLALARK